MASTLEYPYLSLGPSSYVRSPWLARDDDTSFVASTPYAGNGFATEHFKTTSWSWSPWDISFFASSSLKLLAFGLLRLYLCYPVAFSHAPSAFSWSVYFSVGVTKFEWGEPSWISESCDYFSEDPWSLLVSISSFREELCIPFKFVSLLILIIFN